MPSDQCFLQFNIKNFFSFFSSYGIPFTESDSNVLELLAVKEAMKMASNGKRYLKSNILFHVAFSYAANNVHTNATINQT